MERRGRHFQTIHLKKCGIPIPVSLSISPVVDDFDRVVDASLFDRDLSGQFSFEKSLHEAEHRYRKLKSSLELAHHLKETLLPSVGGLNYDLDIFVKTLYSEDVGGDYYDFFHPRSSHDNLFGFAVGDVAGHGTAAALLMALAKEALQAETAHAPFDLGVVMERLNQLFSRHAKEGRFMTLFLAVIDVRARRLEWCSAGQGPVYIYHVHGQYFQELGCTGPPLGVLDEATFDRQSTMLREGDILPAGTDGLWEARNREGEMFSVERFRQLLATWHYRSAEEICKRMLARVRRFSASDEPENDTSLMIVKVPARPQLPASAVE
jgi:sigma-B regulation protein RsbU (phosphoserine phosphatase)